jgi:hypothetical protein
MATATKTKLKADDTTALDTPRRTRPKAKAERRVKRNPTHLWATFCVGLTLTLSAWLNGLAFSSAAENPLNGWVLGVTIPVLVLGFSRVSALLYRSGDRGLAYCGAAATLSMLLLSVQHCAVSIAKLTGEPVALAALMALSLDFGLVTAEIATVRRK